MMEKGFIKVSRSFLAGCLWSESRVFSNAEAWLDLVAMARYDVVPAQVIFCDARFRVCRGELAVTIRYLADRWHWSRMRVQRFIACLRDNGSIKIGTIPKGQVLRIVDYNEYCGLSSEYKRLMSNRSRFSSTPEEASRKAEKRTVWDKVGTETRPYNKKEKKEDLSPACEEGNSCAPLGEEEVDACMTFCPAGQEAAADKAPAAAVGQEGDDARPEGPETACQAGSDEGAAPAVAAQGGGEAGVVVPSREEWLAASGLGELPLDECRKVLEGSSIWLERVTMNYHQEGHRGLTVGAVRGRLAEFFRKLENEGCECKTVSDAKSHFARWLRLELSQTASARERRREAAADEAGRVLDDDSPDRFEETELW